MAVLALSASAAVAGAQSLGELAAKEQERREKERQKRGGASKVITESDLGRGGKGTVSNAGATSGFPSPEASASPSPAPGGTEAAVPAAKEKTADEIRAERENDWRQRVQRAREEVTQLSDRLNRLQQSLNDLSGPIYGASRTTLLGQFETTKTELAAANQKVADLEEEGRRNSYR
jgi:DNA repair exonuclease SbcCD ATPase subunit